MQAASEEDKMAFYETLYYVLVNLNIVLSPIMPFVTEEMYTNLTGNESVHLTFWPEVKEPDMEIIKDMVYVRQMVEAGHRVRKENKLKVRQPLASVTIKVIKTAIPGVPEGKEQYNKLIADELNVKNVEVKMALEADTIEAEFDTKLTPELEKEGKARDLIRSIQGERKKAGVKLEQKVNLTIPEEYKDFEELIRKAVLVDTISYGPELKIS
jgi:isoleucyl-tRNA synthetase